MSILSTNKISIRQRPVTLHDLEKYEFIDIPEPYFGGTTYEDRWGNALTVIYKTKPDPVQYMYDKKEIDFIEMKHLNIPHGSCDLYEGNRLKNFGQLLELVYIRKFWRKGDFKNRLYEHR